MRFGLMTNRFKLFCPIQQWQEGFFVPVVTRAAEIFLLTGVIVLGIVGLSLGTAQWPVIRRHISSSGWWIVGSTLGMAVGLTLGVTLVEQIGRAVVHGQINFRVLGVPARVTSFGIIGLVAGAALGLAQWLVLRRHTANCTQWIRVSALSLGAGLALGSLLADAAVPRSGSFASTAILLLIAGVTAAVSTARPSLPSSRLSARRHQRLANNPAC